MSKSDPVLEEAEWIHNVRLIFWVYENTEIGCYLQPTPHYLISQALMCGVYD